MWTRMRVLVVTLGAGALLLGGCGGEAANTVSPSSGLPAGAVPTAEQLAAVLITPESLGSAWQLAEGPSGEPGPSSGVVTDEQSRLLPRLDLCDEAPAAARTMATDMRWQAFTQVSMTPQDPLDMAAGDRVGHMIFAQESLLAREPAQVEVMFGILRSGLVACLGPMPAEEGDGHTGVSEEWAAPAVGEDRYGVLLTVQEPGDSSGIWLLHYVLVRDGPVLMLVNVVEITLGEGVTPELSPAEVDAVVLTAAERLG